MSNKIHTLILAATLVAAAPLASTPAQAQPVVATEPAAILSLDNGIEKLMSAIKLRRASLPGAAFDIAVKFYGLYRTYKNGEAVEAIRDDVRSTLQLVLDLKRHRNSDRTATMKVLTAHERTLEKITATVLKLDRDFRTPMCQPRFAHKNGKCVDVADIAPNQ